MLYFNVMHVYSIIPQLLNLEGRKQRVNDTILENRFSNIQFVYVNSWQHRPTSLNSK
jgi:hypothetical protein